MVKHSRPLEILVVLGCFVISGIVPLAAQSLQPLPPENPKPPRMFPPAPRVFPPAPRHTQPTQPLPPRMAPHLRAQTPPAGPPPLPTDPAKRREALFERLQDAENPSAAQKAGDELQKLFKHSSSATADLLFTRAKKAILARRYDQALDLLDYVTQLKPDFAEAYHRRALIHTLRNDEEAAMRDLKITLGLEPRHFLALSGLASLLQKGGDKKSAYRALARLREIYPQFPTLKERLERLRPDMEGQAI